MNQALSGGSILQVVNVTPGALYRLTFDATAWAENSRTSAISYELFDGNTTTVLASGTFTDPTGGVWMTQQLQAVATSGLLGVRITETSAFQAGLGVDNVNLDLATPEPAMTSLTGAAVLALLGARRRRRTV
ncbi:MAG: hypothetical protein SGI92_10030 [Bryobacteraceae bacterium]|nr:hypothetical protein [Bryobacteraceae bacterium]